MSFSAPNVWPVIVIGAGASGLLAAIFSARSGTPTLCLDARQKPGAKIRVSGGGRCNVLPSEACLADFETRGSAKAMRNMLMSWPRAEVQQFFEEELGLPLKREDTGKLFPVSDQSRDVVNALLQALAKSKAVSRFDCKVVAIAREASGLFRLTLQGGEFLLCHKLIVATGGLSMPKTGSDGGGWRMLRSLGHSLTPPAPALVPLCGEALGLGSLAGLSVPARLGAYAGGRLVGEASGDFLFTHRGMSGPVVLDISRHYTTALALIDHHRQQLLSKAHREGGGDTPAPAAVDIRAAFGQLALAAEPRAAWQAILSAPGRTSARSRLQQHLPRRLAEALLAEAVREARIESAERDLAVQPASELRKPIRSALLTALTALPLRVAGSEGYRTAEVTSGGVPLVQVATRTLESRLAAGLYICGEALDATGRLGGFNFLWAWVTGRRAGEAAALAYRGQSVGAADCAAVGSSSKASAA